MSLPDAGALSGTLPGALLGLGAVVVLALCGAVLLRRWGVPVALTVATVGVGGLLAALLPPTAASPGRLALGAALAVAALGAGWRRRPAAGRAGLVVPVVALVVVGLVVPAWLLVAGVLAGWLVLRVRRGSGSARPQVDDVDRAALAAFAQAHGTPRLAPVAVVIAAWHEEDGLGAVLERLPATVCGLGVSVVVVDDGSLDATADVAARVPGVLVVRCGTNRGQGAALRLGYRVAREHGAAYVVTTDADGQYDVADLPAVLGPVVAGEADFVTGSRVLGRQHTRDRVRRTGVHVFAWTVRLLTGARVTDTSFGLRAMRAEVTGAVSLDQPQYQSSELLVGVLARGFRVREVPATMHVRAQGSSKKGRNLVYGRRYAGVVLGTWWREGAPAPSDAPALAGPSHAPRAWEDRDHGVTSA